MKFSELKISPWIVDSLKRQSIVELSPVQEQVIGALLREKQLIVNAPTGSGKTLAFLIPILERIDLSQNKTQAIIFCPTRELCEQINNVLKQFTQDMPSLKTTLIIGGSDIEKQILKLKNAPQIIVGTPSRINKLANSNDINLKEIKMFVLDEADMIVDLGFQNEIASMLAHEDITLSVFSATIPAPLRALIKRLIPGEAKIVSVEKTNSIGQNQEHFVIRASDKHEKLVELLNENAFNPYLAIIFASTKEEAATIFGLIKDIDGVAATILTSDQEARKRRQVLKAVNDLQYNYVVATDLVARGIDIIGVSHVISVSLNNDLSYYQHRSGRTGRFKETGKSYVIANETDVTKLAKLGRKGISFRWVKYEAGTFVDDVNKMSKDYKPKENNPEINRILGQTKGLKGTKNYKSDIQKQINKVKKAEREKFGKRYK